MGHSAAPRDSLNRGTAVVTASVSSRPATECERVFAARTLTRFGAASTVPVIVRSRHPPVMPIAPSSRIAMALASDMTRRDRATSRLAGWPVVVNAITSRLDRC